MGKFDKNDMEEYPEEFIDIMKCKDHLVLVNKERIHCLVVQNMILESYL